MQSLHSFWHNWYYSSDLDELGLVSYTSILDCLTLGFKGGKLASLPRSSDFSSFDKSENLLCASVADLFLFCLAL